MSTSSDYRRHLMINTVGNIVLPMKKPTRKKRLTDEQLTECAALKALFERRQKEFKAKGKRVSQYDLADHLGITQGAVNQYLNGVNPLNLSVAGKFAEYLGVELSDFSPRLKQEALENWARIRDRSVFELATSHISDLSQPTVIPVKSLAQIISSEQGIDTMIIFGEFPKNAFGYRLDTDQMQGMRGEYIRVGSMLTIDPDATPNQGDVVLAELGGDPIIGHYVRHAGAVKVRPSNEQYEVTDISDGRILGVVRQWAYAPPK